MKLVLIPKVPVLVIIKAAFAIMHFRTNSIKTTFSYVPNVFWNTEHLVFFVYVDSSRLQGEKKFFKSKLTAT